MTIQYTPYTHHNMETIPRLQKLSEEQILDLKIVSSILPFKSNNYVINELIHWDKAPDDPVFQLNFPQKELLDQDYYTNIKNSITADSKHAEFMFSSVKMKLLNSLMGNHAESLPVKEENTVPGLMHWFPNTLLAFLVEAISCFAFCNYYIRWMKHLRIGDDFSYTDKTTPVPYLKEHKEISDILFKGEDSLIMDTYTLSQYIEPILDIDTIHTIRFATKSLT